MAKIKWDSNSLDTRGLPYYLDPHNFYEYRLQRSRAEAQGVEYLLYRIIPYGWIRSFAIAIDPFFKQKVSPVRITPPNRNLDTQTLSTLSKQVRTIETTTKRVTSNSPFCSDNSVTSTTTTSTSTSYGGSGIHRGRIGRDTTRSTRLPDSDYGECNIFTFNVISSPRRIYGSSYNRTRSAKYPCGNLEVYETDQRRVQVHAPGAYATTGVINTLYNREQSRALELLYARGPEVYRRALPSSRHFGLVRSIVELRDLPRSISQLRDSLGNLSSIYRSISDKGIRDTVFNLYNAVPSIPNEYLSYHFGWKQIYNDVMSTLSQPKKVGRRINYLLDKVGQEARFHSQIKFSESEPASSLIYANDLLDYPPYRLSARVERDIVIRAALGLKIKFPHVDLPKFRSQLFNKMLGIEITPVDLYELTPWSWLVDWFTGLGNYLDLIQEVYRDPNLVNYGFLSIETKAQAITDHSSRNLDQYKDRFLPGSNVERNHQATFNHTSLVEMKTYIRLDAVRILDASNISSGSLSDFQKTILSALAIQRIH